MKNMKELHNAGYVILDGGYIIERKDKESPTPYAHYRDLNEQDIKHRIAFELYNDGDIADTWHIYASEESKIIKYINRNGDFCVGAFYKLKDNYDGSSFIREEDKALVEQLVGRIDKNGKEIRLNDIVSFENGYEGGRVVWLESGFYIYNDARDENLTELSYDAPIFKLN